MFGHGSSYDVGLLQSVKLNIFGFDQVLHLILQGPTVVCIMTRAFEVIGAAGIRVILRRCGVGVLRSFPQSYQIGLQ